VDESSIDEETGGTLAEDVGAAAEETMASAALASYCVCSSFSPRLSVSVVEDGSGREACGADGDETGLKKASIGVLRRFRWKPVCSCKLN